MDKIEKEINELRKEVITLRAEIEKLSPLVASLTVGQNLPQFQQGPQQPHQQQPRQQALQQSTPQNRVQKTPQYDLIPMTYAELFPALLEENLV